MKYLSIACTPRQADRLIVAVRMGHLDTRHRSRPSLGFRPFLRTADQNPQVATLRTRKHQRGWPVKGCPERTSGCDGVAVSWSQDLRRCPNAACNSWQSQDLSDKSLPNGPVDPPVKCRSRCWTRESSSLPGLSETLKPNQCSAGQRSRGDTRFEGPHSPTCCFQRQIGLRRLSHQHISDIALDRYRYG